MPDTCMKAGPRLDVNTASASAYASGGGEPGDQYHLRRPQLRRHPLGDQWCDLQRSGHHRLRAATAPLAHWWLQRCRRHLLTARIEPSAFLTPDAGTRRPNWAQARHDGEVVQDDGTDWAGYYAWS